MIIQDYFKRENFKSYPNKLIEIVDAYSDPNEIIKQNISFYKNATHVHIYDRSGIDALKLLPDLKCVWVHDLKLEDHENLFSLLNLKVLDIGSYDSIRKSKHRNIDLNKLDGRNLVFLGLQSFSFDSRHLENFTNLKYLSLSWCEFDNLDFLENLQNLETLFINTLPTSNISKVSYLKKLNQLSLLHNNVKRGNAIESFEPILNIENLRYINLLGTDISSSSIKQLMTRFKYATFENVQPQKKCFLCFEI